MTRITASSVWLHRAEGPTHLPIDVTIEGPRVWSCASSTLSAWAHHGVDTTDFAVTFTDGYRYEGCFGLQAGGSTSLVDHVRDVLASYRQHGDTEMRASIDEFLATYLLGDRDDDKVLPDSIALDPTKLAAWAGAR